MHEEILRLALLNRKKYGKAREEAVLGKVLARFPELRQDLEKARALVKEAVRKANSMPEEVLMGITEERKKEGPKVPKFGERCITRFAPEPSGFPHIGHAKAAYFSYLIAKESGGEMVLRFDDTNPKKVRRLYEEAIKEGLEWLGITWKRETHTSDYLDFLYEKAEELILRGKAYVCECPQEEIRRMRATGKTCEHRLRTPQENLELWRRMFSLPEGGAVLRYKGEPESENTALRDPVLFRIVEAEHYRKGKKYRVWPSYDFAVAVLDSVEGITHALRSKEYELRDVLYHRLQRDLGLREVELVEFARLKLKGYPVGKRLLRPLVEKGLVMGWDDPRLPTLAGLRRRGIVPEAIRRFVLRFGLKKSEGEAEMELLLAENRKVLDPQTPRRFFVEKGLVLEVEGLEGEVRLRNHPSQDLGQRVLTFSGKFYVPPETLHHRRFRLKDLANVEVLSVERGKLVGRLLEGAPLDPKLQWVPVEMAEEVELWKIGPLFLGEEFNPRSLTKVSGFSENLRELSPGDHVQFERIGFARMDSPGVFVLSP